MLRRFAGPGIRVLAIVSSIVYLVCLSWARWADPLVDFGQQLYLAWQVNEGKLLYRDLAYYNGPLSVYVNAAAFRLFGVGLWTLIGCNAVVLGATIALLYRLFRATSSSWSASAAVLVFVWLFAFGRYFEVSNYNYLCPYNHEMTHGLFLSLAMIALLNRGLLRNNFEAPIAGMALGLVFLTKAELSLAALGAATTAFALSFGGCPGIRRSVLVRRWTIFWASAAVPMLGAFAFFASHMPPQQAWRGTIGSWAVVMHPEIRQLYFYRKILGTADLQSNLAHVLGGSCLYGLFLVVNGASAWATSRLHGPWRYAVAACIGIAFVWAIANRITITEVFLPLPIVLLGLLIWLGAVWRNATDDAIKERAGQRIVLVVFAGLLLLKMAAATRIVHYGFVLAMPAVLVACVAFTSWIPEAFTARRLFGNCFAVSSSIVVLFFIVLGQAVQHSYYSRSAMPVGSGRDYMLSESPKAETVARMVHHLRANTDPHDRILVFPEGASINYLSSRESGVPYTNFMPPEVLFFSESAMLAAIKNRPPDWIVVAPKDFGDYRVCLGEGFLDETIKWIDSHYREETRFQSAEGYQMKLLRRR